MFMRALCPSTAVSLVEKLPSKTVSLGQLGPTAEGLLYCFGAFSERVLTVLGLTHNHRGLTNTTSVTRRTLVAGVALFLLCASAAVFAGDEPRKHFDVAAKPLGEALMDFGVQSGLTIVAPTSLTAGKTAATLNGDMTSIDALRILLAGTGLTFARDENGAIAIQQRAKSAGTAPKRDNTIGSDLADDSTPNAIGEVVVTAEKRSERLQDVPMTVNVVNPTTLVAQGDTSFEDYLIKVPGVAINFQNVADVNIGIRGMSSSSSGGNPLVSTTIDDVPLGSSTYLGAGDFVHPDLDPSLLSNIEVLKGPQGTLYGASSMGGLIKFDTKTPDLIKATGSFEVDGSDAAHGSAGYGIRGSYSAPIIADLVAVQASAFYRQDPGFINDPEQSRSNVNDDVTYGGRFAVVADIGSSLRLRASAIYQKATSNGFPAVDVDVNLQPIYGPYEHERIPGGDAATSRFAFYDIILDQKMGFATLSSLTSYQQMFSYILTDSTANYGSLAEQTYDIPEAGVNFANTLATNKISQEFRLTSNEESRLTYVGGLFYTHESTSFIQNLELENPSTGAPLPLSTFYYGTSPSTYEEYAAYLNANYQFNGMFDVQAGVRTQDILQDYYATTAGTIGAGPETYGSSKEHPFIYSVGPRLHLDKDTMLYARISTGFRPGGPNASPPPGTPASFRADETTNYEAGIKADMLENRISVDLSVFYIDWSNIQTIVVEPSTGFAFLTNQGSARSKGFEGELSYRPIGGLAISESFGYTQAYVGESSSPDSTVYALRGAPLPYVPKWTETLAADYKWRTGDLTPAIGATYSYTGARSTDFVAAAGIPRIVLPAFSTVNLHASVAFRDVTATLFLKNVTDSRGYVGFNPLTSSGPYALTLINPRTIGISLSTVF
jgi:iron complex outermembrane receptor protein